MATVGAKLKKKIMQQVPNRNEQFENIARLRTEYEAAGNPIISLDTKKKEKLGNFYREGHLYTLEEITTWDHDFNSFAEGIVIPHGIYDLKTNVGYIQIGVPAMRPRSLPVIVCVIGGIPMALSNILRQRLCLFYVMAGVAIVPDITSSNTTCNSLQMNLASKFA